MILEVIIVIVVITLIVLSKSDIYEEWANYMHVEPKNKFESDCLHFLLEEEGPKNNYIIDGIHYKQVKLLENSRGDSVVNCKTYSGENHNCRINKNMYFVSPSDYE